MRPLLISLLCLLAIAGTLLLVLASLYHCRCFQPFCATSQSQHVLSRLCFRLLAMHILPCTCRRLCCHLCCVADGALTVNSATEGACAVLSFLKILSRYPVFMHLLCYRPTTACVSYWCFRLPVARNARSMVLPLPCRSMCSPAVRAPSMHVLFS